MNNEVINLMLHQPFERIMEMAARQGITVHYSKNQGGYFCKYTVSSKSVTVAGQTDIKLAVANAIVCMQEEENHD